ncbi:hypothetical protein JKA74_14185 [Marivirga sp. S37H4]|uniref:Lipoprotein n=1 Tax=Marivirga aurantiaca TaxID=2802615 RepID=A0A934X0I8_9BACT|nr:hypothetical protein [Marivirga aurantiaca]MBK6266190.1 hypothetical protein [Marivirga aurantiaca]
MKKAIFTLLLLSIFFLLSCDKKDELTPEFALDPHDELSAEEYLVYSASLERMSIKHLIINQKTSVYTPPKDHFELFFSLEKMKNMEPGLFDLYLQANQSSYLLDEKIEVATAETKLMSNEEYAYYFEREDSYKGWDLFKTKYPESNSTFVSLNNIGFNEDKTQAMLGIELFWFMESPEGPTLKAAGLHYLEKKEGVWTTIGITSYPF